jgi:riboflavin kinase/FMN adenylyltransferase
MYTALKHAREAPVRIVEWDDFTAGGSAGGVPGGFSAAIGVFDGVHRGHQALMARIKSRGASAVITFRQNPRMVLNPGGFEGDIYSLRQKLFIFEELGIDICVLIDFSGNFSRLKGREFVELLKGSRALGCLAVGENFRCGSQMDTDAASLRNLTGEEIYTELVPRVCEGRHPVSSSRIRGAIKAGDLRGAASLLGRPFGIDLSGIPSCDRGEHRVFDAFSALRVIPPSGSWQALVYAADKGVQAAISVEGGKLFIPRTGDFPEAPDSLVFLTDGGRFQ